MRVPGPADEAVRDLVRARDDSVRECRNARHRLKALLLRNGITNSGKTSWTAAHLRWLARLKMEHPAQQIGFQEYLGAITDSIQRIARLEQAMRDTLNLCPGTRITGGKAMSGRTKRSANRAAQALRLAAAALRTSQSALGAYLRRMCSRMDKPKAVTAAAHKLARLIYTMLTKGEKYVDQGQDYYEERCRERVLRALNQRAAKLGLKMIPVEQAA